MKVNDLYFAYDKDDIIKGVSFDIKRGKITTLMGANGCGKSTLFQLMTKNLKPRAGSVMLDKKDINTTKLKEFARNVAIVHQCNKAPSDISIENLVSYGRLPFLNHLQQPREEDKNIVQWALEVTGLQELRKRAMGQLSGGQRQRAWIGMSLAQKPQILFLDEPTTYLDVKYQIEILRLIKELNEKYNMTIVMVLHDINQAIHYSDEIIGMKNGNILFQGRPHDVISEESIQEMYGIHLDVEYFNDQKYVLAV